MKPAAESKGKSRKRGLLYMIVGLLLLIGSLLLLSNFMPKVGSYAIGPRLMVYAATGAGWWLCLLGVYRLIAGAGGGALRTVAIVVVCLIGLGALFGVWVVHTSLTIERTESDRHHRPDWD